MCVVRLNPGSRDRSWLRWPFFDDVRGGVREQEKSNMFRLHWLQVGGATRGMPRRDRPAASHGPSLGWLLALRCFKAAVSQVHSAIAAAAAVVACSARAVSSAACRVESSTGAMAVRLLHTGRSHRRSGGICGACRRLSRRARVVTPSYPSGAGSTTTPSVVTPLPGETPSELDRVDPLPKSKITPRRQRLVQLAAG